MLHRAVHVQQVATLIRQATQKILTVKIVRVADTLVRLPLHTNLIARHVLKENSQQLSACLIQQDVKIVQQVSSKHPLEWHTASPVEQESTKQTWDFMIVPPVNLVSIVLETCDPEHRAPHVPQVFRREKLDKDRAQHVTWVHLPPMRSKKIVHHAARTCLREVSTRQLASLVH